MEAYDAHKPRKDAIKGVLENALTRLFPDRVVIFKRTDDSSVNVCGMEMRQDNHESVRYINQEDIRTETMVFLGLRDSLPPNTQVQLSRGLEIPAGQLDALVRSVLRVGAYDGPLPFYADVFYRADILLDQ